MELAAVALIFLSSSVQWAGTLHRLKTDVGWPAPDVVIYASTAVVVVDLAYEFLSAHGARRYLSVAGMVTLVLGAVIIATWANEFSGGRALILAGASMTTTGVVLGLRGILVTEEEDGLQDPRTVHRFFQTLAWAALWTELSALVGNFAAPNGLLPTVVTEGLFQLSSVAIIFLAPAMTGGSWPASKVTLTFISVEFLTVVLADPGAWFFIPFYPLLVVPGLVVDLVRKKLTLYGDLSLLLFLALALGTYWFAVRDALLGHGIPDYPAVTLASITPTVPFDFLAALLAIFVAHRLKWWTFYPVDKELE